MKFLLIHLSDIHFKTSSNSVVARAGAIAAAAKSAATSDVNACVIAITGDIAHSGLAAEYALAEQFIAVLHESIAASLPRAEIRWVVVPGNHDCAHRESEIALRNVLIDAIRTDTNRAYDEKIVQTCTAPQDDFFGFLNTDRLKPEGSSRLMYEYSLSRDGVRILFRCLNTAWLSTNPEKPGALVYPIPQGQLESSAYVISLFHHPSNWLEPTNARAFRNFVERSSDLILTGHEHDGALYTKVQPYGPVNEYIEGAVLQDSDDSSRSGFGVILFDFVASKRTVTPFIWDGAKYVPSRPSQDAISLNSTITRHEFTFSDHHQAWLDDPELALTHPAKDTVTLDDVFVWPDIREIAYGKKHREIVRSKNVFTRLDSERYVVLAGEEKAGKTAVAKQLIKSIRRTGRVPVYLSCRDCKVNTANLTKFIDAAVAKQYGEHTVETFRQMPKAQKAFVVDDLDRLTRSRGERLAVLDTLSRDAARVVVFTQELTPQLDYVVGDDDGGGISVDFRRYRIMEFGHLLRHSLFETWTSIGMTAEGARERFEQNWPTAQSIMDAVVGRNFVPSHPVFLLSIFQALESARPIDTNASTFGYFYEMFIRKSLGTLPQRFDPNTTSAYLSRVAWAMFEQHTSELEERQLRSVHEAYEREMDIHLSFPRFVEAADRSRILVRSEERYAFKYRYIYYYFVASYLRDHLSEEFARAVITQCCQALYVEDNAHILIFLAHLSRDPFLIDSMLAAAGRIYADVLPAQLESDVEFVNRARSDFELIYEDGDVRVSRRRILSTLDEFDDIETPPTSDSPAVREERDEIADVVDPVLKLNVALKTVQIIGQVLKNYTGAIRGDIKTEMANSCYQLGLRSVTAILDLMRDNEEAVVTAIFHILRKEHPRSKDEEIFVRAKSAVYDLAQIITYGIIKRVAQAVGSDRLSVTYDNVLKQGDTNAVALIDCALRLDHSAAIPETQLFRLKRRFQNNPLAESLLKYLVVHRFYLFEVHYIVKQRVCARLDIPYKKIQTADHREKLIVSQPVPAVRALIEAPKT